MIDYLSGVIHDIRDKSITLLCQGVGFTVYTPHTEQYILQNSASLFIYFNWSADNGPALYGFQSQMERDLFLLIIDCPKIGPSIAINILNQLSPGDFCDIVTQQNSVALSGVNGIGPKKAEHIIFQIKDKVPALIQRYPHQASDQQAFVQWQQIRDVLTSLNYSKQEIAETINVLNKQYAGITCSLDQLIRQALAHLSSKQL